MNIRQSLLAYGRPVVSLPECAIALRLATPKIYRLIRNDPANSPPTFRAGGAELMMTETAVDWCEKVAREWNLSGDGE
jgi:hypothetical protein